MGGEVNVIVGAQWGDEGKGKIVDHLSEQVDIVARYQGGANAGHTAHLEKENAPAEKYILHIIPLGALRRHVVCVIGNGVALLPGGWISEVQVLNNAGYSMTPERLKVSDRATITCQHHQLTDILKDLACENPIGTTGQGIGPTYVAHVGREALKAGDISNPRKVHEYLWEQKQDFDDFARRRIGIIEHRIKSGFYTPKRAEKAQGFLDGKLAQYFDREKGLRVSLAESELLEQGRILTPYVTDTVEYLLNALEHGKNALAEGSQGLRLDVNHGIDYPNVTSSSTGPDNVQAGLGIPSTYVKRRIAVVKCIESKVGEGGFLTEYGTYEDIREGCTRLSPEEIKLMLDRINHGLATDTEIGIYFRSLGEDGEFGATTGRPRRTGRLDIPQLIHDFRIHGITEIAFTKLDCLEGLKTIEVCTTHIKEREEIKPVYGEWSGFKGKVLGVKDYNKLNAGAKDYIINVVKMINERVPVEVGMISTGPNREDAIVLKK